MAWSCGVIDMPGAISRLLARLTERGQSVVFLLDGIEQVFQELDSSEAQRRAVRALLQDVPNWLRENGDNRVGAIIFVQRSTVTAAVRRNSLQLMALYEEYSLS
jgi:metal-responsive CopG/Arc/MetJ family transcriptional regulator